MKEINYLLPQEINKETLISDMSLQYNIKDEQDEPPKDVVSIYYDTFDRRLFSEQLLLSHKSGKLSLCSLKERNKYISLEVTESPHFVKDLPESELRSKLEPIVEMRALMSVLEVTSQLKTFSVFNKDGKPLAGITFKELKYSGNGTSSSSVQTCCLEPIKGEKQYLKEVSDFLSKKGLNHYTEDPLIKAFSEMDIQSLYSSKMDIALSPQMHSDEASRIILRHLLKVMRANEEGIKKDIDSEFLHDFRVAIRRTRAFLSDVKNIFPQNITERFKSDFRLIGKETNMLRDLDVYLLDQEHYINLLPPQFRNDIRPLFDYLQEQKNRELSKVAKVICSQKYLEILNDWEAVLDEPLDCKEMDKNACTPISELAHIVIYKCYRTVIKSGKKITETSPDEILHALRIKCKKLRYMMEFFSSLYPMKKIKALIKQLKKLQDNLGQFQDLCIQVNELQLFVEKLPLNGKQPRRTIMATGILIGRLEIERQNTRNNFSEFFKSFSSSDNRKHFDELFLSS